MPGTSCQILRPVIEDKDFTLVQLQAEPQQEPPLPLIPKRLLAIFPDPALAPILNAAIWLNLGCAGETTPTKSFTNILDVRVCPAWLPPVSQIAARTLGSKFSLPER